MAPRPSPRDAKAAADRQNAEAEALAARRRAQAVSLLTSLAEQARDFALRPLARDLGREIGRVGHAESGDDLGHALALPRKIVSWRQ